MPAVPFIEAVAIGVRTVKLTRLLSEVLTLALIFPASKKTEVSREFSFSINSEIVNLVKAETEINEPSNFNVAVDLNPVEIKVPLERTSPAATGTQSSPSCFSTLPTTEIT